MQKILSTLAFASLMLVGSVPTALAHGFTQGQIYIDHPMIIGDTNFGFDPTWHCYASNSEPVCLKTN